MVCRSDRSPVRSRFRIRRLRSLGVVSVSLAEAVTVRGWSLNSSGILTGGILKTAFWAVAVSCAAGAKTRAMVMREASFQFKSDTSEVVPFTTVCLTDAFDCRLVSYDAGGRVLAGVPADGFGPFAGVMVERAAIRPVYVEMEVPGAVEEGE